MEIGVHRGDLSKQLFLNFSPQKLILVDPWMVFDELVYKKSWYGNTENFGQKKQDLYFGEVNDYFKKEILNNEVEIHRTTSDEYFINNKYKFDLIYIDGNHHSDNVLRDARNSFKLLNKGGFIVFDDFLWDYYNEINLNPIGGVKQFLFENFFDLRVVA